MKKLMNYFMLSCKKAAELIDRKSIFELNWKQNIQLQIHTKMCAACNNYQQQSKAIDRMLEKHIHDIKASPLLENKQLKENILHSLKK